MTPNHTLRKLIAEFEAGWLPFFLHRLDLRVSHGRPPDRLSLKPSEYFQRQVFATFINDPVAIQTRHLVGVDNLMWSSDYPHGASTWPNSKTVIDHTLGHLAPEIFSKVVRGNVTKLYNLPAVAPL